MQKVDFGRLSDGQIGIRVAKGGFSTDDFTTPGRMAIDTTWPDVFPVLQGGVVNCGWTNSYPSTPHTLVNSFAVTSDPGYTPVTTVLIKGLTWGITDTSQMILKSWTDARFNTQLKYYEGTDDGRFLRIAVNRGTIYATYALDNTWIAGGYPTQIAIAYTMFRRAAI